MNILFEDENIVVVQKEPGLLSEGNGAQCLPYLLSQELKTDIFPVHRLDRGVGGVMVCAKNAASAAKLSAQVQTRAMQKEYLAVVHGELAPGSAVLEDLLFKDSRKNKTYVVNRERKGVRKAVLSYETVRSGQVRGEGFTVVRVRLQTGRSHQIRVQFASRKHPLFGDGKYGACDSEKAIALWSYALEFVNPASQKRQRFELEPPEESLFFRIENR